MGNLFVLEMRISVLLFLIKGKTLSAADVAATVA